MNLNKNKNSHIEMLLLAVMQELKKQLHYEMEEALAAKINAMEEKKLKNSYQLKKLLNI